MTHLSNQDMVRLAMEVDEHDQLEEEDLELAEHIFSCNECQNKFAICINSLKFLRPDSLEKYFSDILQNNSEQISSLPDLQEFALCKMRIVIDRAKKKVKCITDFISEGLPQFNVANGYAYARGNDSDDVEVVADESIIVYSKEKGQLVISLDEEIYGEKHLIACIESGEEERQGTFVSDGRGMIEVIFDGVQESEEIKISIINQRLYQ